ncbi:MAG: DNA mismatch repair protein MutS [Ruminococcaceae bacterium]|nr:DNA mismatch repair protein MutS [Oscillospiraceae bacterium]
MAELTPMMRQYFEIKERNRDCILFFRLGDFYEMFAEDAKLAAKELELTLTTRDKKNKAEGEDYIPMCGIPYHSSEGYIARLIAKGYKVAICEQTEDPAQAKGLVRREIVRVVTPGALTESSMLEESRNNYMASLFGDKERCGLCFCDISTGAFYATALPSEDEAIISELGRFSPTEIILGGEMTKRLMIREALHERLHCCISEAIPEECTPKACREELTGHFRKTIEELGLSDAPYTAIAAGALLLTLRTVQRSELSHIRNLDFYRSNRFMELDLNARRNLELTETLRGRDKRGTLLWVLDKTKTAMGTRMLRSWLDLPLLQPDQIERRLDSVEELCSNMILREELAQLLSTVSDLERIISRIVSGTANCRDFNSFASGCAALPAIRFQLEACGSAMLSELREQLDPMEDLKAMIDAAIDDNPPFTVREGGMIREGYSAELDELRRIMNGGTDLLAEIAAREREKTGIRNLKVGYNRVFGYYIEVSKGQIDLVPDTYIRKQTLANNERYITQELKELENTILNAREHACALEYRIYCRLRDHFAAQALRVQRTAQAIAGVDALQSLACVACANNYCRPTVDKSCEIRIRDGRHPVVEKMLRHSLFVPNDTDLGVDSSTVAIITGPNMAGKSTYMRQVALITLMAQVGSFVPAASAHIGVTDRIFTRIGASDDLASGRSTFMVEMSEVAELLRCGTARSLLILDEIGRGTSTFDGMAIARAVLEYVADPQKLGARTLFATHYHELADIEQQLPNVKNYNIAVKKRGEEMIFLRKIVPGAVDDSYGVEVARLAGLPEQVIARSRQILAELEAGEKPASTKTAVYTQPEPTPDAIRTQLQDLCVETLTPIEALNVLYQLKQQL